MASNEICRPAAVARSSLPIRPRPIDTESAHGYLMRIAQANGHETAVQLWRTLRDSGIRSSNELRVALALTEEEWACLSGPWPRYCGFEDHLPFGLERNDYLHGQFRWCPKCLDEMPYLHCHWSMKLGVTCLEHACYLLDTCPRCLSVQRIEQSNWRRCTCGQSLTVIANEPAASDVLTLQSALAGLRTKATCALPSLTTKQWLRLLHRVAALIDPEHHAHSGQVPGLHMLSRAVAINRNAAHLLAEWPMNFHALLAHIQSKTENSFSLSRTFGRLYRWLYVDLGDVGFSFLREAFDAYVREHWWGLVCRRNQRLHHAVGEANRSSIREAAKKSGSTPTRVKQLHLAGLIDATKVSHVSGRQSWSVPTKSVVELAELETDSMDLRTAAAYVALPRHRVRELVDAGLLHPRLTAGMRSSSSWMLSKRELNLLGIPIVQQVLERPVGRGDLIAIVRVLKTWRLESGAFPALALALANGRIAGIVQPSADTPFGKMRVPVEDLRNWLAQWRKEHLPNLSISEAAKALGIKEQVAYDLVQVGLLRVCLPTNRHARRISITEISRFQETYVAASTLCQLLETSSRALLDRTDVAPVTGPSVDGRRQYFFKRSDADLILAQASPPRQASLTEAKFAKKGVCPT